MNGGRGKRGGFFSKLGNNIQSLFDSSNEEIIDISDEVIEVTGPTSIVYSINANKNADMNRLSLNVVCFFAFVNVRQPREVNLTTVVKVAKDLSRCGSSLSFKKFSSFKFEYKNQTFIIKKVVGQSQLDDTPYDIKRFQLRSSTLVDEFTIWFSIGDNEKTVVLWQDFVIGVLKIKETFFVFDPNFNSYDGPMSCILFECDDIHAMARCVHDCLTKKKEARYRYLSCLISVNKGAITPNKPRSTVSKSVEPKSNITNAGLNSLLADEEIIDISDEVIEVTGPTSIVYSINANKNADMNRLSLNVVCFFAFVNVRQPREVKLTTVVKVAKDLSRCGSSLSLEKFSSFEFNYEKQTFHIQKVVGKSQLDDTPYDIKRFQLRSTTLVDEFTIWFSMGDNEKTVVLWHDFVIAVLKIKETFFVFDPNFNSYDGPMSCILFECDDIDAMARCVHDCLTKKKEARYRYLCCLISVTKAAVTPNIPRQTVSKVVPPKASYDITGSAGNTRTSAAKASYKIKQDAQKEIEEKRQRERENKKNKRTTMTEAEKDKERNKQRDYEKKKWDQMSDEQRRKKLAYEKKKWDEMTEAEKDKERNKQRDYEKKKWDEMTEGEKDKERNKQRDNIADKRSKMTDEEKKAAQLKSKEYFKKKEEQYSEKRKLSLSIRQLLKFKGKKEIIKEKVADVFKRNFLGKAESAIEADKVVNVNLQLRENLVYEESNILASIVYTLKKCKAEYEKKDSIANKFVVMMGAGLHTNLTELYFVDGTYNPMMIKKDVAYSLKDGKIMNLFTALTNTVNETVLTKWHYNEMCTIDVDMVYNRFKNIIERIVNAEVKQLIELIDTMDDCSRKKKLNNITEKIRVQTTAGYEENCKCDYCNNVPSDDIYVYCSRKDGLKNIVEEACECEHCDAKVNKLGHPHACYIDYNDINRGVTNYGCNSLLLFLRRLAPHYPFIRKLVLNLYKARKQLKRIKEIDSAVETLNTDELKLITNIALEKAGENFVSSTEWPYSHENLIISKFYGAFLVLRKLSADVADIVCISCLQLCYERNVTNITEYDPKDVSMRRIYDDLLDHHERERNTYEFMCDYCYGKYNDKQFPPTCILNNLIVRTPPACISRLNDYEKLLIQRAKAFQVVTRMGTVSGKNRPNQQFIQKVKGRTFHLPLPLEKTLEKMPTPQEALARNQEFYILVRGVPTKQKQVWESYVNVNYVYEALEWLKKENYLYKNIQLPSLPEYLLDELGDEYAQFDFNEKRAITADDTEEAMLTQKDITDSFYEHVTIHSLGGERPNEEPSTIYQIKKVSDKPIDNREKDLDMKCFPDLFCYGESGQHSDRQQPLSFGEFVKSRLKSVHLQFRLNIQYLFFLLNLINLRQILSGIYTSLNTTPFIKNMTAKVLRNKLDNKEFDVNACNTFTRLRNSMAFWNKPRNDINCMIKNYGPATWFLTFSPSEYHWEDLDKYLRDRNGRKAVGKSTSALIAMDPINTSRFINNKFKAMLKFITHKSSPIGEVAHYAWRREYQGRGLQHFHLLIWVKDAPTLGMSSNEEVSDFISKYVTCHIPDKDNFPTLNTRVLQYQQHHCNTYCKRTKFTKQKRFINVCRFGFARPTSPKLILRDVATSIYGRRKLKLKSRLYDLKRTDEEVRINDYNPAILMAWEGNMDIQFIGEKSCALTSYITKYNTKAEKSYAGDGFNDIAESKSLFSKLWLMGQRILSSRECGSLEAADTLLQIPLFGTDKDTTIKWLDVRKERNRKLKDWNYVKDCPDDNTDYFCPSLIDDHYPNRPEALEDVCLFDFASKFIIVDKKPKSKTAVFYPYKKSFFKERDRPCLINHYNYDMEKHRENYFYSLLVLFKPFRSELELLGSHKTYSDSFDASKDDLSNAMQYHTKLQDIDRARKELDKKVQQLEKEDESQVDNNSNVEFQPLINDDANDIRAFLNIDNTSDDEVQRKINSLNADQLRVFNSITSTLTKQNANVPNTPVLRKFISGVGGTGKSYLIDVIKLWTKTHLNSDTMVGAPTGLASFNVKGLTLHRIFRLPISRKNEIPKYEPLSDIALKELRNQLKNVALIIIDEISMVSNVTLLFIHRRLQEMFNSFQIEDGWFGGMNILCFGDLLQLPPPVSTALQGCVFETVTAEQIGKCNKSLPCNINLWEDLFSYDELTINVRQKTDTVFADLLGRIRVGNVVPEDCKVLQEHLIPFKSKDAKGYLKELMSTLEKLPENCVCLLPTKKQCAELNEVMLSTLPGKEIVLRAKDTIDSGKHIHRSEAIAALKRLSEDDSKTGGFEETVVIKKGCKVMLRQNINPAIGLVNGAIGIVLDLHRDAIDDSITAIKVRFHGQEHLIPRSEVKFLLYTNVYVVRSQFPLMLAYGITIHKSQSLSLDCVAMDIGNSTFAHGMSYVALSRATTLPGVYLINFDPRQIQASTKAIEEYNRLRSKYRPDLNEIPLFKNKCYSVPYRIWWKKDEKEGDPTPTDDKKKEKTELPGFKNLGTSCYANSILQCLFANKSINEQIMSSTPSVLRELTAEYNNPTNKIVDAKKIIEFVGLPYGVQQDPHEFIMRLDISFPDTTNLCEFEMMNYMKCHTALCTHESYLVDNQKVFEVSIPQDVEIRTLDINEIVRHTLEEEEVNDYRCDLCHEYNLTKTLSIRNPKNLLIIKLNILVRIPNVDITVYQTFKLPLKMKKLSNTPLRIAGSIYELKSATFHYGNDVIDAHYISYVKQRDGWYKCDDTRITKSRWVNNSKDAYILFYEKK